MKTKTSSSPRQRMIASFLRRLRRLKKGGWQAKVTSKSNIRLRQPGGKGFDHDPITALYFVECGKKTHVGRSSKIAKDIGLTEAVLVYQIIFAADDTDIAYPRACKKLRQNMIAALGLQEVD